ncbi:MAG TPA: hypothetical protein VGG39_04545 [Polyangiaceae bacterium]
MERTDDAACGPQARAWAAACSSSGPTHVEAFECPAGHVVFAVTDGSGPPAFVDATRGGAGMRQVQGISVSPVGEFADFRAAPRPVKEAFARVVGCVQRDPAVPLAEPKGIQPVDAQGAEGSAGTGWLAAPWCLLAGVVVAAIALGARTRSWRRRCASAGLLVGAGAALLALAHVTAGASFFHQNGHGANWIAYALGQRCPYGPGFPELFGWAARLRPARPEALVFACNAAFAASCPATAWLVARRAGAPALVAWALALGLVADPLLWRLAFTESYYVACTSLVLAATAVSLSAPTLRAWSPRFLGAQVAAGLLAAQAARVHPVGWIAIAVAPFAQLATPGGWKRSSRHAAISLSAIGATVGAAAGQAVIALLRGATGAQYVPEVRHGYAQDLAIVPAVGAGAVLLVALLPALRTRRLPRVAYAALAVIASAIGVSLLGIDVDWVKAAHAHLFAASFVAAAVGLAQPWMRRPTGVRAAAAVVAILAAANAVTHARWALALPTDALELRMALAWREQVPPGSRLVAVETAGITAVELPLYGRQRDLSAPVVRLDAHGPPPALPSFGDRVYWARTSLCTTQGARAWCDAVEASAVLEPVDVAEVPARPSTHAVTYDADPVRVGLYRVVGAR